MESFLTQNLARWTAAACAKKLKPECLRLSSNTSWCLRFVALCRLRFECSSIRNFWHAFWFYRLGLRLYLIKTYYLFEKLLFITLVSPMCIISMESFEILLTTWWLFGAQLRCRNSCRILSNHLWKPECCMSMPIIATQAIEIKKYQEKTSCKKQSAAENETTWKAYTC